MTWWLIVSLLVAVGVLIVILHIRASRRRLIEERKKIIRDVIPGIRPAFSEIGKLYSFSHYITESERVGLFDKHADLFTAVGKVIGTSEFDGCQDKENVERFFKAMSDTEGFKKINNKRFIEQQLSACKAYFDSALPYPLDAQQREAVVALEDNVLVISSAGSGKTMTTVAKVRYLMDICNVDPSKILLITFTHKAADSLSERIGDDRVKCRTFHKLALEIIGKATGEMPTLTAQDFSVQVYHRLFDENSAFHDAVVDFMLRSRYRMKSRFEYTSMQEYISDRKKYGVQAYFKDMDGKPVFCKSDEESQICDFLGSRGVRFRYEEKYEHAVQDSDYRQYCPDFSIYYTDDVGMDRRIYLEHFAVNEHGNCPSFFTLEQSVKYKKSMEWKRALHGEKGTVLLCTTSGGFHRGDVFQVLSKELSNLGVKFTFPGKGSISRELARQEEGIVGMLSAFNFLLKSKGTTPEEIRRRITKRSELALYDGIVFPYIVSYRRMEEERGEIDFTDAIIRATDLCNDGHRPDYDYILVDEFQDLSLDRYRFLQSLRKKEPMTKLFCVGDDWQSIYRFAGSDMALFKRFGDYFGYVRKCFMETTYRFGEPAIADSSRFILSNPLQEKKTVRSFRADVSTKLAFISTGRDSGVADTVEWLLRDIPVDKEVLLVGRYSFDVNVLRGSGFSIYSSNDRSYVVYQGRRINFLTVHQSKGLEADFVIVLNCNGGTLGFPSGIADSPILNYVLSEPDRYPFSEERRLFYVAITRAKVHTWVLYDMDNPSPFVKEFVQIEDTAPANDIPVEQRCPRCGCGRRIELRKGIAVNGNPYSVQTCSNKKYGCDYFETVFINLNAHKSSGTRMNLPPRMRIGSHTEK